MAALLIHFPEEFGGGTAANNAKMLFLELWTKYSMHVNGQVLVLSPVFAHSLTADSSCKKQGRRIGDNFII